MSWFRKRTAKTDSEGRGDTEPFVLRAGLRGARGSSSAAQPANPAGTPFFDLDQAQRVHLVKTQIDAALRKQETDPAA